METSRELYIFFQAIKEDARISITHIGIYAALLQFRSESGLANPIQAFSHQIMRLAKISGLTTYTRCIKQLAEYGYIEYKPSFKRNQASKIFFLCNSESKL